MKRFETILRFLLPVVPLTVGACAETDRPSVATEALALDYIPGVERGAALLVTDGVDLPKVLKTLDRIGAETQQILPPRLIVARIPKGSARMLSEVGVVEVFDRAVFETDLVNPSVEETRFLSVYSNRHHPDDVPPPKRIQARQLVRAPGDAFETAPSSMAEVMSRFAAQGTGPEIDPEFWVSVPYAAGTVVVSVFLPESNGSLDPSTEDWTEPMILETYQKIQAALDHIASLEPNANLKFILHYESAPAPGGLPGTIDCDYEFGQHANFDDGLGEAVVTANVMSRVLGREVTSDSLWMDQQEYVNGLKARYGADAAFYVKVAANGNFTAGLRAHAWIYGPTTTLDSTYGYEVFMHEFGHIFGALDEYCPDACVPPTALQGYVGIANANAYYFLGGPGIDDGKGESAPSLMAYNETNNVNGYTRAAWGWLDTDGDGVLDVRETHPSADLRAELHGFEAHLVGEIKDLPASRLGSTAYSSGRIRGFEYRIDGRGPIWVDLSGATRGKEQVDVSLGALSAGAHTISVRAQNDSGNFDTTPNSYRITVPSGAPNAGPHLSLKLEPSVASTRAPVLAAVSVVDPEGDPVEVRFDFDGDGTFDTPFSRNFEASFVPGREGVIEVVAEARDASSSRTAKTTLISVEDAPPALSLSSIPSIVHDTATIEARLRATSIDPEGDAVETSWSARLATADGKFDVGSPFAVGNDEFAPILTTPESLRSAIVDLTGNGSLPFVGYPRDMVMLDGRTLLVALGPNGIATFDIKDRAQPTLLATLGLETNAEQLHRNGNRVFVLGSALTIVDVGNPSRPFEVKQRSTTRRAASSLTEDFALIPDGSEFGWYSFHWADVGQRIESVSVQVSIDHQRHEDLIVALHPPKDFRLGRIILTEHGLSGSGVATYSFDAASVPELGNLVGALASDVWQVEVIDDQLNGIEGTLLSSQITWNTVSRAKPVLRAANSFVTQRGRYLMLAGIGFQVLDIYNPTAIRSASVIQGTGVFGRDVSGNTVFLAASEEQKGGEKGVPAPLPPIHGLVALDISRPNLPRIVRQLSIPGLQEIAAAGSLLYLRVAPELVCDPSCGCGKECPELPANPPYTIVADAAQFANGGPELGRTPYRVDGSAFLEGSILWALSDEGTIQRLDVSDPTNIQRVASYSSNFASELVRVGTEEVLLPNYSLQPKIAKLHEVTSILSRTYRITATAKDSAGNETRQTRHVQIIPYDHQPSALAVEHWSGFSARDTFQFFLRTYDPDAEAGFDGALLARADFDGDGHFDTDWFWGDPSGFGGVLFSTQFPGPGAYKMLFEVRDSFHARATLESTIEVR